jgi:hypothetical protein
MGTFCGVRPCPKCPFRTDGPGYLTRGRAAEIAATLERGGRFACHATVDYSDSDGEGVVTSSPLECAGAVIVLEKMGRSTQMMRIAERLGMYSRDAMDLAAPVFDSLRAFVRHHRAR